MKPGNSGGGKGPYFRCALEEGEEKVIGDEPGNTNEDPDASEEAVPKGEGRAELPFLSALRQDVPGGYSGPCLRTGKVQSGRAGRGWAELPGDRIARVGGMAERRPGGPSC